MTRNISIQCLYIIYDQIYKRIMAERYRNYFGLRDLKLYLSSDRHLCDY